MDKYAIPRTPTPPSFNSIAITICYIINQRRHGGPRNNINDPLQDDLFSCQRTKLYSSSILQICAFLNIVIHNCGKSKKSFTCTNSATVAKMLLAVCSFTG